ncbi:MAG: SMP-30/gluconolactonase/LRE family protein [Candidatus Eisenbacteria bacterium]|nr:SMP-30/gluconolactonase/LRE family protein [Candidatus Eisenbacteria bacterium]
MNRCLTPARALAALLLLSLAASAGRAEMTPVDFESGRWDLTRARVFERDGRKCLSGSALLGDADFADGVIEVDVLVARERNYPGVNFRIQSPTDHEKVYLRPHRFRFYPDAVQYCPSTNGIASWQIYNGDGATAGTDQPYEEWITLRIEVKGERARVFYGDMDRPVLEVPKLGNGISRGALGLEGDPNGACCFADFRYRETSDLAFDPLPPEDVPPGFIGEWEISRAFPLASVDMEAHPDAQDLAPLEWRPASADARGIVDVGRTTGRTGRMPDGVYARAFLRAEKAETMEYRLAYSDIVAVFLNGRPLYFGNSAYQSRDRSFLGVVGFFDHLFLPLREGENELLLLVGESFGGWAFGMQDADAVLLAGGARRAWETGKAYSMPEAVLWDGRRGVFYVSNYDAAGALGPRGSQTLSRIGPNGEALDAAWVGGLANPTGMALRGDRLWVVERTTLAEIDVNSGEILSRVPFPEGSFPNDVTVDGDGVLYVSDNRLDRIYRVRGGEADVWLEGAPIDDPNGLCAAGGVLFVGNSGDGTVKAVDTATGEIRVRARLSSGIIDGLVPDGKGNLLVSHWEGRLFRIDPEGKVEKLIDTSVIGDFLADFGYDPERTLVVAPLFYGDRLAAFALGE